MGELRSAGAEDADLVRRDDGTERTAVSAQVTEHGEVRLVIGIERQVDAAKSAGHG
jgi:hypothetical protein